MGITNIGIVYPKMIGDAIVSQLNEGPEFIRDFTRIKETRLVRKQNLPIFSKRARQGAVRKGSAGVGVRDLNHHTDWGNGIQRQGLVRIYVDSRDLLDV